MARILFLYSEMMPYMERVIKALVEEHGDTVCVVSWDHKKLTPHQLNLSESVIPIPRSTLDQNGLTSTISAFSPDLIYVSGRMDTDYLKVISSIRKRIPIVSGMDTQWNATLKQFIQILLSRFLYKKYFSHIWVPGQRQYTLARLLGYNESQILSSLLTGDVELFKRATKKGQQKKIVFLGRLEQVKGVDLLLEAWKGLPATDWELWLIGDGTYLEMAKNTPRVKVTGFLKQQEIVEVLSSDSIFCLPSRHEPWGVVVHEMAAAGLPLILSSEVGAGDAFLIHGYNGYLLKTISVSGIQDALQYMINLPYEERQRMSRRSVELGNKITPALAAHTLHTVLK